MADVLIRNFNMVIPLLGLLILISLFLGALNEPKRNYSGPTYLRLLLVCAGLLGAEELQTLLNGRAGSAARKLFGGTMAVYYLLLTVLCWLWTLYAYYWFNGYRPKGMAAAALALAPVSESAFLMVGVFVGKIYQIDADGIYHRGSWFAAYVLYGYLYLIGAITVSAISAIRRNEKKQQQEFQLFLLFFIFPLIGPLLQYLFSSLTLLGTTQAIALLAVYVAVQQRANIQYALEKARFYDDSKTYENSMEKLLAVSPDALCVFHLNLTKNNQSSEHIKSRLIRNILQGTTVDDLFSCVATIIQDEAEARHFLETFNRDVLLQDYQNGRTHFSLGYHRKVDGKEIHWIVTYLTMLKNPGSGDVEAIVYSMDMDKQEKEAKVVSAITEREYDSIALIDRASKKFYYQHVSQKTGDAHTLKAGDYDNAMREELAGSRKPEEAEEQFARICYKTVTEMLEKQEEYSYVYPYPGKNGEMRQKKNTYCYLDERKTEILFFRSDITEETQAEREKANQLRLALQQAQHANAMKTEFLSNVSHDMRTPLNAVLGYIRMARRTDDPDEMKEYLDKIDRASYILLSLINDTLDLSKIETGVVTLKPAPISCGEVIKKVVAAVRPSLDEKNQHFVLDNSRAVMATIRVDALRLQEIFINLLSNAIKFTPPGGEITMVVECIKLESNCVHDRVIVRDTGCGISKEFLPKIYEPFSQERQASTRGVGGSGLGLSITKKLVEMMNGTIEVKSELGKGTEFTLCLDFERVDDELAKQKPVPENWEHLSGRKILLVEDNEMNTEIAKALLTWKKMQVVCAENGKIACDKFAASAPGEYDAILMDIRMPVMNGREATEKIRQMARPDAQKIPIIAMSADAFDDDVRASEQAGMNAHLAKPVDPTTLYEVLSRFMP